MGLLFGRKHRGTTIIARFMTSNRTHMLIRTACDTAPPHNLHDPNPRNLDSRCKLPGWLRR